MSPKKKTDEETTTDPPTTATEAAPEPSTITVDPDPVVIDTATSDQGIEVVYLDTDTIAVTQPKSQSFIPPFALRVNGRTFEHVSENAEGHWVYRYVR